MPRILLLLALLCPVACPQKFVLWWDGTWNDALREARQRNVPILVGFVQDGEEANDRIVSGLYQEPGFIKLTRSCVPVIACPTDHATMKQNVRGHTRRVCSRFGAIGCGRHRQVERQIRKKFWPDEVRTPCHIVVLPDGKEVDRILDVAGTGSYEDLLKRAQRRLGQGIAADHYVEVVKRLKQVDAALAGKQWAEAISALDGADRLVRKHPLEKRTQSLWERINREGQVLLARAVRLDEHEQTLEAMRLLQKGLAGFKGATVHKSLKSALARMGRSRAGRAANRVLKLEARLAPEMEKARKAARAGDWIKASRGYRKVIKRGKGTVLAKEARQQLEELEKDPDIGPLLKQALRKERADDALRAARRLLRRDPAAGRDALRKLIEDHPGTPAARMARTLLERGG